MPKRRKYVNKEKRRIACKAGRLFLLEAAPSEYIFAVVVKFAWLTCVYLLCYSWYTKVYHVVIESICLYLIYIYGKQAGVEFVNDKC